MPCFGQHGMYRGTPHPGSWKGRFRTVGRDQQSSWFDRTLTKVRLDRRTGLQGNSHGLGSQSSGNQEHFPASNPVIDMFFDFRISPRNDLHLDSCVFLGSQSLTLRTIVVHTRLAVLWAIDSISFSELDFAHIVQLVHLPSDEGVVIWVDVCGQERSTPINTRPYGLMVLLYGKIRLLLDESNSMGLTTAIGGKYSNQ